MLSINVGSYIIYIKQDKGAIQMIGDMQNWTPNVAGIIEHAKAMHPKTEVISRLVSGKIHRSNYEEVCIRSRKLASALEKDGVKKGDVIATLALNTYRHLEMYYGISGMGAITHTLNFRLHPEQDVYIINHAEIQTRTKTQLHLHLDSSISQSNSSQSQTNVSKRTTPGDTDRAKHSHRGTDRVSQTNVRRPCN